MAEAAPGFATGQFRLDGKRALITGGRGALAEAMAATLADLGCAVALASRREADCAAAAASLSERFGVPAFGLACNISDEGSVEAAMAEAVGRLGGLDILVNNAGASWWGLPQDIPLKGWQKVMDVNVTGTFLACRHAARHMIANGGGSIINIASVGAFISYRPDAGQVVPYTTSKAAIVHLTSDLAAQWAEHGIRVNAIAPGSIDTAILSPGTDKIVENIPLRRLGKTAEVADIIFFLCSNQASYVTGSEIHINGGQHV